MSNSQEAGSYQDDDHRISYVFNPLERGDRAGRASKRRKVAGRRTARPSAAALAAAAPAAAAAAAGTAAGAAHEPSGFIPLFHGAEKAASVRCREKLFETSWSRVNDRVQDILRRANQTTLEEVDDFVRASTDDVTTKIPAAFIIAGPTVASQDLLFEQLSEKLHDVCQGRFVRIRSAEAPNLNAVLKKIIRDATVVDAEGEDDPELAVGRDGRKYLDYDLEALYTFKSQDSPRVILAFEDGEAFDSGLLSDLVGLFSSWRDRIRFTILFGIATSVDLFQARLLRSTCRQLHVAKFDVAQTASILDSLVKCALASADTTINLGPSLLRSFIDRQSEQVAGIQAFVSSLKYAYMCHFFANPLSVFVSDECQPDGGGVVQPDHLQALRSLPSFKKHIEALVAAGHTDEVRRLLRDDEFLQKTATKHVRERQQWAARLLQSLHLTVASGLVKESYTELYIAALAGGVSNSPKTSPLADGIRRMSPDELIAFIQRIVQATNTPDELVVLEPWPQEPETLVFELRKAENDTRGLLLLAEEKGAPLQSTYTAQSKVLRTTVVAQKVQLSRDSAALTKQDRAFTEIVDLVVKKLAESLACAGPESLLVNEVWLYDSRAPYKDVFLPRPGTALSKTLLRPSDYLDNSCRDGAGGVDASALPAISVLYKLYLEAGALVNVADLWSAFYAVVGENRDAAVDERTGLVLFYRALAELKAMGFVKASRKKADHIAKMKWL